MRSINADIVKINKNFIFKNGVTEEDIFYKYLGYVVDYDEWYVNPLRNDNNADCRFFYGNQTQRIWFIDFAGRSYDAFNIVEVLYGVNYYKACEIIATDFGLLNIKNNHKKVQQVQQTKQEKIPVTLRVKPKKYFTKAHLDFWKQYIDISNEDLVNDLLVGGIRAIDIAWIESGDRLKKIYQDRKDQPAFVYELGEGYLYEFYFPYNKEPYPKHIHSTNLALHYYANLPKEGEYVVISKSRKDSFLMQYFNIISCSVLTERKIIDKVFMDDLQTRFSYIFTLFDTDKTGYHLSWRMRKTYGTIPLFMPKEYGKDFSDCLKVIGRNNMNELVQEFKDYYSLD